MDPTRSITKRFTDPRSPASSALPMRIVVDRLTIRDNSAPLSPWLGPSLRGLFLRELRETLCRLPIERRPWLTSTERRWSGAAARFAAKKADSTKAYCRGCEHMLDCLYGRTLEPDLIQLGRPVHRGARDGLRALSVAVEVVDPARRGHQRLVRWLAIGADALAILDAARQAARQQLQTAGIGQAGIVASLSERPCVEQELRLEPSNLTTEFGRAGQTVPVRIVLQSPLFLKRKTGPRRPPADVRLPGQPKRRFDTQARRPPTPGELVRESVRTVRRAIQEYLDPHWTADRDLSDFVARADRIEPSRQDWTPFQHARSSNRQQRRWDMAGWMGEVTVVDMPECYLPWLHWGGLLGVGDSRNCGAGLWGIERLDR
ncbi:MAG: hypothetical protein KatS3mg105_5144 [Gemmatales bacterium]|nr:MAG: hypothetical protein KatS3mg105_5144 [Gemmatales bacterium]GIW97845.1 MAG: hypothetical protein KatS3mg111_1178 [Pirellulaceae bacterium]